MLMNDEPRIFYAKFRTRGVNNFQIKLLDMCINNSQGFNLIFPNLWISFPSLYVQYVKKHFFHLIWFLY